MIKKLASTLPNLVHSIFSKLNKDDNAHNDQAPPSSASSSTDIHPAPSSKQTKNPFFVTRDYLDHTLDAICSKAGLDIPAHLYHALIGCLVANDHLMIDTSRLGGSAHVSGFALLNILPYLVGLRCVYVMCTASTTPQELFRKLLNSRSQGESDMEFTPSNLSSSHNFAQPPSPSLSPSSRHKPSRSLNTNENTVPVRQHARHRRNSSRLRPNSVNLTEEIQHALHGNMSASQSSLPQHSPSMNSERDRERERERGKMGQSIYAQVLVVDNLTAAPAHTLAALYQVMKTRQVPYKGYKYNTPSVFIVIGISGKQSSPVLSPSPFLMNIPLFDALVTSNTAEAPTLALSEEEIVVARNAVAATYLAQDMHQYIRNIVMSLRNHPALDIGPDTRVVSALENSSKTAAVIAGQKFVTPTHILSFVAQVLNHRMSLIPNNSSPSSNPLSNSFASSPAFVHATSKFLTYVHTSRYKNKEIDNTNSDDENEDSNNSNNINININTSSNSIPPSITVTPSADTTTTTTTLNTSNNGNNNNNNNNTKELDSNLNQTYTYPNFPTPVSAEIFVDSFEVIESLLNQLDVPV